MACATSARDSLCTLHLNELRRESELLLVFGPEKLGHVDVRMRCLHRVSHRIHDAANLTCDTGGFAAVDFGLIAGCWRLIVVVVAAVALTLSTCIVSVVDDLAGDTTTPSKPHTQDEGGRPAGAGLPMRPTSSVWRLYSAWTLAYLFLSCLPETEKLASSVNVSARQPPSPCCSWPLTGDELRSGIQSECEASSPPFRLSRQGCSVTALLRCFPGPPSRQNVNSKVAG